MKSIIEVSSAKLRLITATCLKPLRDIAQSLLIDIIIGSVASDVHRLLTIVLVEWIIIIPIRPCNVSNNVSCEIADKVRNGRLIVVVGTVESCCILLNSLLLIQGRFGVVHGKFSLIGCIFLKI